LGERSYILYPIGYWIKIVKTKLYYIKYNYYNTPKESLEEMA